MRFSLAVLLLSLSALAQDFAPEDREALRTYQLTEDNVEKVMRVNERLAAEARRDRSFVKELTSSSRNDRTLGDSIRRLGSNATVKAALDKFSISSRDFVLTNVAGMQAAMVAKVRKESGARQHSEVSGVNPVNLEFVESHAALMARWRESSAATASEAQRE